MQSGPTVALYVRIPAELDARVRAAADEGRGYRSKGALQAFVIRALEAAAPAPVATKKTTKKGGR